MDRIDELFKLIDLSRKYFGEDFLEKMVLTPFELTRELERLLDESKIPYAVNQNQGERYIMYYGHKCTKYSVSAYCGEPLVRVGQKISDEKNMSLSGSLVDETEGKISSVKNVFLLIKEHWMGEEKESLSDTNTMNCVCDLLRLDEKITEITISDDDTKISIRTKNFEIVVSIDNQRQCCEDYGGFVLCEDDFRGFIGENLRSVYLTDTFCNTKAIDYIPEYIELHKDEQGKITYELFTDIQFVNFETTRGILQFVVYNAHNGYYGHDVSVFINGRLIYDTII